MIIGHCSHCSIAVIMVVFSWNRGSPHTSAAEWSGTTEWWRPASVWETWTWSEFGCLPCLKMVHFRWGSWPIQAARGLKSVYRKWSHLCWSTRADATPGHSSWPNPHCGSIGTGSKQFSRLLNVEPPFSSSSRRLKRSSFRWVLYRFLTRIASGTGKEKTMRRAMIELSDSLRFFMICSRTMNETSTMYSWKTDNFEYFESYATGCFFFAGNLCW